MCVLRVPHLALHPRPPGPSALTLGAAQVPGASGSTGLGLPNIIGTVSTRAANSIMSAVAPPAPPASSKRAKTVSNRGSV